jgi:hypothetical protein
LPFGVLYFGFGYVMLRHHVYYVYGTPYDGEGRIFPWLMGALLGITVLFLFTLVGVFYLRGSPTQASLTWPVIFVVVAFWVYENSIHGRSFDTLPLQEIRGAEGADSGALRVKIASDSYRHLVRSPADPGQEPSSVELRGGVVAAGISAAQVFLHPAILRSRLGPIRVPENGPVQADGESKAAAGEGSAAPDPDDAADPFRQISFDQQLLNVPARLRQRRGKKAAAAAAAAGEKDAGSGGANEGAGEEELAGGVLLLRSRWLLWSVSQVSALIFIAAIFYYWHAHHKDEAPVCQK